MSEVWLVCVAQEKVRLFLKADPQSKYSGFRTRGVHEEANDQDSVLSFVQIFPPFFLIFSIFLPKSVLKVVKMWKQCSVDMTVQQKKSH